MSDYNSSLPVRTENPGDVVSKLCDATTTSQQLAIDSSGRITTKINDGAGNAVTSQINGAQRALDVGIDVAGVQIDPRSIRALTSSDVVSANIRDNSGNAFTSANPLPVTITTSGGGTKINSYNTLAALAAGGTSNHDYTVTALKTLSLASIWGSASGKLKIEIQVETGAATGVFNSFFVGFNSTATPNILIPDLANVSAGVRVRVIRTNEDKQAMDVYSTISGVEA
jgi:hypothetical protein